MCGIIGYNGDFDSRDITLKCLKALEYRGYDSCGVAFFDENNITHIVKTTGRVDGLIDIINKDDSINKLKSNCCIAHTRWATHGGVTDINAHPHEVNNTILIHNGIIENFQTLINTYDLKSKLKSETDTEVACQVLDLLYERNNYDPIAAIKQLVFRIKGTYTFLIMFKNLPGEIFAIRSVSPLVVGKNKNAAFLGSDIAGLIEFTKEFYEVPENVIIHIKNKNFTAYDINIDKYIELKSYTVDWTIDSAKKGGYQHYMLKEINEQPEVIEKTILAYLNDGKINVGIKDYITKNFGGSFPYNKIQIVACGTALHAGTVAANVFKKIIRIPIETYIGSEYRYTDNLCDDKTLVIIISQSGETIDTYESLKLAKSLNAKVVSIVNVKGSSIDRASDLSLYTHAGPEIAVASTKAYTCQIVVLYLIFIEIASILNRIDDVEMKKWIDNLLKLKSDIIEFVIKMMQN